MRTRGRYRQRVAIAAAVFAAACVYRGDDPCGPGQTTDSAGYCVCVPGAVPDPVRGGCAPCGAHEVAQGGACACAPGHARPAPGQSCAPCAPGSDAPECKGTPTGQGKSCASQDDCAGAQASFCDTVYLKQCLVPDCKPAADSCQKGWICCDVTPLGLARTLCLPAANLPGMKCPGT